MSSCCDNLADFFPKEHLKSTNVATEKDKTFRLGIPQGIQVRDVACLLTVDNGWIKDNKRIKCDFLMVCCPSKQLFLIELKGDNDHKGAVDQIIETYKTLKIEAKDLLKNHQCTGYVIASSVPKADTGFFKAKEKAMREHKLKIERVSQKYEHKCIT